MDVVHTTPDLFGIGTFTAAIVAAFASIVTLAQLARRSKLYLAFEEDGGATYTPTIDGIQEFDPNTLRFALEFCAHNIGKRTSRDYYVTILLPDTWNDQADYGSSAQKSLPWYGSKIVDGTKYRVYQTLVNKPLYPGRWAKFATRRFWVTIGDYTCLWHLVDEDGAYPKVGQYGNIKISVRSPSAAEATK